MLTAHRLSKAFDLKVLFEDVSFSLQPGERIGLVGPNGCGKTTLLRVITGDLSPLAGRCDLGATVRLGRMDQDHSELDLDRSALETLLACKRNETEARSHLARFYLRGEEALKPLRLLSHGQRARLAGAAFGAAVQFAPPG